MKTKEAIQHFGTAAELARSLDIFPAAVYQWGEYPPLGRQCEIEILTNGELRADRSSKKKTAA